MSPTGHRAGNAAPQQRTHDPDLPPQPYDQTSLGIIRQFPVRRRKSKHKDNRASPRDLWWHFPTLLHPFAQFGYLEGCVSAMASGASKAPRRRRFAPMNKFIYDLLLWTFSILVDLFFREVHPRSSWKIPRKGPVIFVAAPHANQVRCKAWFKIEIQDR